MGTTANNIVKSAAGVEFGLKWGIGRVESVVTPKGKVNGRVQFRQDGFKHPSAGSVEIRRQAALIEMLREAEGSEDVYFAFRLESHRDDKVDKDIPFDDIVKDGKANDNTAELIHSRLIAAFPDGTPEAKALIEQCEADAAGVLPSLPPLTHTIPNEPAPNQLPGESWEFAAAMGCVDLAFEELSNLGEPFSMATLTALSEVFLQAADQAQTDFSGRLNRGGKAHTRARGAIRTAIKRYPIPDVHATDEEYHEWAALLTKTAFRLMNVAQDILARSAS